MLKKSTVIVARTGRVLVGSTVFELCSCDRASDRRVCALIDVKNGMSSSEPAGAARACVQT